MNRSRLTRLTAAIHRVGLADYPFQSRVQRLHSYPGDFFLKRDDELGFGVTGSKFRKFRTLLPSLISKNIDTAVLIGGAYSNNIVGLVQLLKENRIEPKLLLCGGKAMPIQGNHLLIRMMVPEQSIVWIPRDEWKHIDNIGEAYNNDLISSGKRSCLIPEGSFLSASLPGALSLPLDMLRNEEQMGLTFERLFIDAGSGMMAAAALLAFAWMERPMATTVVAIGGDAAGFLRSLEKVHFWFEELVQDTVPMPVDFEVVAPPTAQAFGSVNAQVQDALIHLAHVEGVLTDPIYSTKLLMAAQMHAEPDKVTLAVHSGGALSLMGFQEMLMKRMK